MRLIVRVFGRDLFEVSTEPPEQYPEYGERDHLAAQVERAEPCPIGFQITPNPSLEF